jgi:hypothetical protein
MMFCRGSDSVLHSCFYFSATLYLFFLVAPSCAASLATPRQERMLEYSPAAPTSAAPAGDSAAAVAAAEAAAAAGGGLVDVLDTSSSTAGGDAPDTVCSCLCCFQGGCVAIPNGTFAVESCDGCSGEVCRGRIAMLDTLWQTTNVGRLVQRPPCLVLHVSETRNCARNAHCKHFTTIHAQCVDRGEYFQMYSCILWLTCVVGLLVRGCMRSFQQRFQCSGLKAFESKF